MKIHCSLLEPKLLPRTLTNTLASSSSQGNSSKSQRSGSSNEYSKEERLNSNYNPDDSMEVAADCATNLTKLECVKADSDDKEDDLRLQLNSMMESPTTPTLYTLTAPSVNTDTNLGTCQLSPQSDSSSTTCLNISMYQLQPAPTPPSSDMEDYTLHTVPTSYYSLSPPDLLSPPMSTSDPCMSPGDSMSSVSPPHYNLCSQPSSGSNCDSESQIIPIQSVVTPYNTDNETSTKSIINQPDAGSIMMKHEQSESLGSDLTPAAASHNHIPNNLENNQHLEDETISFLSSSATITTTRNQNDIKPEACTNCSQKKCSCIKQSKLKQLFNLLPLPPQPQQDNSSFHQEGNFMKLMANYSDKNIKESMKVETKDINSTATSVVERGKISTTSTDIGGCSRSQTTSTCPLPPDIPTLDSLSKSSPKLSTWRQTRIISEKLEQHLWTWRCACKKSGKRISKSLLQARAKWAFRKAGIVEFKASDGWYWKWLSKWRRKGEEIGITEQGELSQLELQVLPPSTNLNQDHVNNNISNSIKRELHSEDDSSGDIPQQDQVNKNFISRPQENNQQNQQQNCTCFIGDVKEDPSFLEIKKEPIGNFRDAVEAGADKNCVNAPSQNLNEAIRRESAIKRIYTGADCLTENDSGPESKIPRKDSKSKLDWCLPQQNHHHQHVEQEMSFIPFDGGEGGGQEGSNVELIPARKVAVSEILPLTLVGNQVSLGVSPTNCALPLSPIFIKTSSTCQTRDPDHVSGAQCCANINEIYNNTAASLLDNLDEITSLPTEFLNIESLSSSWQENDMEDIDTDHLVSVLCFEAHDVNIKTEDDPTETGESLNKQSQSTPATFFEDIKVNSTSRDRVERCSSGGILSSLLSRSGDTEGANNQTVVNTKTTDANINKTVKAAPDDVVLVRARKSSQEPCGHQCKRIKQVSQHRSPLLTNSDRWEHPSRSGNGGEDKLGEIGNTESTSIGGLSSSDHVMTTDGGVKQQLTVIARHKKRGEESLNKFKEEVRKFAVDHTFKETAKKFGIHHSTVSGWVKESEKADKCANFGDFYREKGDDKFIYWLRDCREAGRQVSLGQVKAKVTEILSTHGQADVEKTCKWFLLWHNRREEKLYVEGMEDEDMKKETQNLAYPPAFKLEVALFAKKHSQYAAAKIFNVARRRIFDWMRQIPKLEELIAKGHMKKMTGRGPKNRDIDQALYNWYCERKASGNRPKSCHVQSKARELYLTYGYVDMKCSYGWFKRWSQRFQIQLRYSYDDEIIEWILSRYDENLSVSAQDLQNYGLSLIKKEDPSFKASSGWALRFSKRHKEFLTSDGTFAGKMPPHLENRIGTFRSVLAQLQREKQFPAYQVGAMDELCVHWGQVAERRHGGVLRHHGMDTASCCVILAATADGNLLPPFLVIKPDFDPQKISDDGKIDGEDIKEKVEKKSSLLKYGMTSGVVVEGDGALVGPEVMATWLEHVWFRHVPATNFLLADSYHVHTAQTTQKLLLEKDSCLAIIPNACSAKLQPLHQGIKEKFKIKMEEKYLSVVGGQAKQDPKTSHGPSQEQVLAWVDEVFHDLRQNKKEIAESFTKTEIFCRIAVEK